MRSLFISPKIAFFGSRAKNKIAEPAKGSTYRPLIGGALFIRSLSKLRLLPAQRSKGRTFIPRFVLMGSLSITSKLSGKQRLPAEPQYPWAAETLPNLLAKR